MPCTSLRNNYFPSVPQQFSPHKDVTQNICQLTWLATNQEIFLCLPPRTYQHNPPFTSQGVFLRSPVEPPSAPGLHPLSGKMHCRLVGAGPPSGAAAGLLSCSGDGSHSCNRLLLKIGQFYFSEPRATLQTFLAEVARMRVLFSENKTLLPK